jgi:hypothetical protein
MASSGSSSTEFDTTAVEETVKRIEEMNKRMIESSKAAGRVALDAYENALKSMLDFQEKVANASQLDWVSALANTHAQFVQEVSAAYIKATRETLK